MSELPGSGAAGGHGRDAHDGRFYRILSVVAVGDAGDILKAREQRVRDGEDKFVDWDQAKKNIRNSIP